MTIDVKAMPKIDLHLHLDGALDPELVWQFAADHKIDLGVADIAELRSKMQVPADCTTLTDFLKTFEVFYPVVSLPGFLSRSARLLCRDLKEQNVIYSEFRYAPVFASPVLSATALDSEDFDETKAVAEMTAETKAVLDELLDQRSDDFRAGLILCFMRGSSHKHAAATVKVWRNLAAEYGPAGSGVLCGFDLAGDETRFPGALYTDLFAGLKKDGVPVTVHAAEGSGPGSARAAIEELGATRLGHGIRIREDGELYKLVREQGIVLEMCPTSNIQTGTVKNIADHPFVPFLSDGVTCTINTDDPSVSGITITSEWQFAVDSFKLSVAQVKQTLLNAAAAAFTDEAYKSGLKKTIEDYFWATYGITFISKPGTD